MPRDGNGVYSKPAGIDATPGTTIESADWNSFTADVEQDMNTARPIVAGGSGSTTAVGAADNLSTVSSSIASATTTDLSNATGINVTITGTTTITGFGTEQAGARRYLTFSGILTLTHHATSLILPGGANITTAAGDTALAISLGSGNWRVVSFTKASGKAVVAEVTLAGAETLTNKTLTSPIVNNPTLALKQGATATPTAEGVVEWDTDDNVLAIGDGAATKLFVPIPASTAAGDLEYFDGAKSKARLAKGTAGQALVMNGGATAPTWQTINYGAGVAAIVPGAIGSMMFANYTGAVAPVAYGGTVAGSTLQPVGLSAVGDDFPEGASPSGTWVLLGAITSPVAPRNTLFQRIS